MSENRRQPIRLNIPTAARQGGLMRRFANEVIRDRERQRKLAASLPTLTERLIRDMIRPPIEGSGDPYIVPFVIHPDTGQPVDFPLFPLPDDFPNRDRFRQVAGKIWYFPPGRGGNRAQRQRGSPQTQKKEAPRREEPRRERRPQVTYPQRNEETRQYVLDRFKTSEPTLRLRVSPHWRAGLGLAGVRQGLLTAIDMGLQGMERDAYIRRRTRRAVEAQDEFRDRNVDDDVGLGYRVARLVGGRRDAGKEERMQRAERTRERLNREVDRAAREARRTLEPTTGEFTRVGTPAEARAQALQMALQNANVERQMAQARITIEDALSRGELNDAKAAELRARVDKLGADAADSRRDAVRKGIINNRLNEQLTAEIDAVRALAEQRRRAPAAGAGTSAEPSLADLIKLMSELPQARR